MGAETSSANQGGESSHDDRTSVAEALFAECLEHPSADRPAVLEKLCNEHPAHGTELRELAASLEAIGLPAVGGEYEFPERLGDFRLLRRIGSGGMGVVYLAEQESFGRQVALKLMHPAHHYFPGARERFRREANAIAGLKHNNIVSVHAIGEEQGVLYMVMEWIDGLSLATLVELMRGRNPLELAGSDIATALSIDDSFAPLQGTWTDACAWIVAQVANALAHAHDQGVVHRDVKPSNVMVTPEGRVVLLDFGLAMTEQSLRLTKSGTQPGSAPYMSPEQVRGESAIDARSDIYSLGVTFYELLTLQLPYLGNNDAETRQMVLRGQPMPVRARNPGITVDAEVACHEAFESRPNDRYPSATAFAADLDCLLRREPIRARPPGVLTRVQKWGQRNPAMAAMTTLLALVLLVAYAWILERNTAHAAAKTEAENVTERVQRLSDRMLLRQLYERITELPPLVPENAGAYAVWVADAEALAAKLALHRRTLARLDQAPDTGATDALRWETEELRAHIGELETLVDPAIGELAFVRERAALAAELRLRTLDAHAARWLRAAEELRADRRFAGVELLPQLGLIPLGADPDSGLQEFLHLASHAGAIPRRNDQGRLELTDDCGVVLVLLPGGAFWMGTQRDDPDQPNYDPVPLRFPGIATVELAPFFIGKHEVTQAQWWRSTRTRPGLVLLGHEKATSPRLPACYVDWDMAKAAFTRIGLQLPTEAQWEFACRAGARSVWSTGSEVASLAGHANLAGRELASVRADYSSELHDDWEGPAPVGTFAPNRFGLHDMHGNVQEWCRDGRRTVVQTPPAEGDGDRKSAPSVRALRGGSSNHPPERATSAFKSLSNRNARHWATGVRPARALER